MHRIAWLAALAALTSHADEGSVRLKDGAGRDMVVARCSVCHSLDYIQMNAPFLDRKAWEGEVNKMISAFTAPIGKEEVAPIVDYLHAQYGKP